MNHKMKSPLPDQLPAIRRICRMHQVKSLHAFGSVLRDDFGPGSDIDLLVEFDRTAPGSLFLRFFDFKQSMESLLGHPVDLITSRSISNPFFKREVDATKTELYAA